MIVLDASLLVALAANDPRSGLVVGAIGAWIDQKADLRLPELARYELASGLTRLVAAGAMRARQAIVAWKQIEELPFTYHRLGAGPRVIAIARSLDRSSAYDAAYLALGEELDATVWTLDARLYRNAAARGYEVRLLEDDSVQRP